MILITVYSVLLFLIVLKALYNSVPHYLNLFLKKKKIEYTIFTDLILIESLSLYFNSTKINICTFLFTIFVSIFLNIISLIDTNHIAYCMDLSISKEDFTRSDLIFLRKNMRLSEELTAKINSLNEKPKFFINESGVGEKISYDFIFNFKKYKITTLENNKFVNSFGPGYSYLPFYEKKFNNASSNSEKLAVSLEILIYENQIKCKKNFRIYDIDKSFEEQFPTPIQKKASIDEIIRYTIRNLNNSYDILYCIKSHPILNINEKKELLKTNRSAFFFFFKDYECLNSFFIKKIPINYENPNDVNFIKILSKFHKLNFKNLTLMKSMCVVNKYKIFENINIESPTLSESEYMSYSSNEDIARILDGTTHYSDSSSFFSDNSDEDNEFYESIAQSVLNLEEESKENTPDKTELLILEEESKENTPDKTEPSILGAEFEKKMIYKRKYDEFKSGSKNK